MTDLYRATMRLSGTPAPFTGSFDRVINGCNPRCLFCILRTKSLPIVWNTDILALPRT
jgi:hypothetical protein